MSSERNGLGKVNFLEVVGTGSLCIANSVLYIGKLWKGNKGRHIFVDYAPARVCGWRGVVVNVSMFKCRQ